jgi:DNA-binding transcriptional MerR regulator
MRVSELSERSDTPIATIKYYIREGLIPRGEPRNARASDHDEVTVDELKLIRGLVHTVGLSISQVRKILEIIREPDQTPAESMTRATVDLPLSGPRHSKESDDAVDPAQLAWMDYLLGANGFRDLPDAQYVRQTKAAMALALSCGIGIQPDHMTAYARAAREAAEADFRYLPLNSPGKAVEAAVLGTAIYEPILLGLRRLAHRELVEKLGPTSSATNGREDER